MRLPWGRDVRDLLTSNSLQDNPTPLPCRGSSSTPLGCPRPGCGALSTSVLQQQHALHPHHSLELCWGLSPAQAAGWSAARRSPAGPSLGSNSTSSQPIPVTRSHPTPWPKRPDTSGRHVASPSPLQLALEPGRRCGKAKWLMSSPEGQFQSLPPPQNSLDPAAPYP